MPSGAVANLEHNKFRQQITLGQKPLEHGSTCANLPSRTLLRQPLGVCLSVFPEKGECRLAPEVERNVELWIGDAAEIHRKRERKQKTDRQDAQHILRLLLKDDFPRIWVPSWENRDVRQLLWHRHRMVQARTRMMNQLQAVALNKGLGCKKKRCREAGRKQVGGISASSVGEPTTAGSAGVAGSTEPDDRGVDAGD
jgi:hypothetical protein